MADRKIVDVVETVGKKRVYKMEDGSIEERTGGSVSWRNNNPGNLKFEYANSADKTVKTMRTKEKALSDAQNKYDGIVGLDQWGNAIFETLEAGRNAKIQLLTGRFKDLDVHQMIRKYSKHDYSGGTHWDAQEATIYKEAERQGVNIRNKKIKDMSLEEISALADGIAKFEGFKEGQTKNTPVIEQKANNNSYDRIMEMIQGLSNDKDGSFAKKLLEENQDVVAAFEAKIENITQQNNVEQTQKELNMEQSKGGRSL